jgi:hypothetical protein
MVSVDGCPCRRTLSTSSWAKGLLVADENSCVFFHSRAPMSRSLGIISERAYNFPEPNRTVEGHFSGGPTIRPLALSRLVGSGRGNGGSASEPFGYRAEESPAFCPRTHDAMVFQSGSSWDVNCLPPWWVSAMPPTSGASGISSNRLVSGLPGVTSFETT